MMVREDHSNKDNILPFSAHNTNFKGWKAFNQPHLPNINMSNIAVEPSTYGQYGGSEQM